MIIHIKKGTQKVGKNEKPVQGANTLDDLQDVLVIPHGSGSPVTPLFLFSLIFSLVFSCTIFFIPFRCCLKCN
jgi:hypothetical protein